MAGFRTVCSPLRLCAIFIANIFISSCAITTHSVQWFVAGSVQPIPIYCHFNRGRSIAHATTCAGHWHCCQWLDRRRILSTVVIHFQLLVCLNHGVLDALHFLVRFLMAHQFSGLFSVSVSWTVHSLRLLGQRFVLHLEPMAAILFTLFWRFSWAACDSIIWSMITKLCSPWLRMFIM